jgi:hypothetical protein
MVGDGKLAVGQARTGDKLGTQMQAKVQTGSRLQELGQEVERSDAQEEVVLCPVHNTNNRLEAVPAPFVRRQVAAQPSAG